MVFQCSLVLNSFVDLLFKADRQLMEPHAHDHIAVMRMELRQTKVMSQLPGGGRFIYDDGGSEGDYGNDCKYEDVNANCC